MGGRSEFVVKRTSFFGPEQFRGFANALAHLKINLYHPWAEAIAEAPNAQLHGTLFGKALHKVHHDPDLLWLLLSKNRDALVHAQAATRNHSTSLGVDNSRPRRRNRESTSF